jgi:hypothetical protein
VLALAGSVWLGVGCASTYDLAASAHRDPVADVSRGSATLPGFSRVVVVPPPGMSAGQGAELITRFEQGLLGKGLSPVSSAEARAAAASGDVDEAVEVLRHHGVEVVVRIARWSWTDAAEPSRFFIVPEGEGDFREVSQKDYKLSQGLKHELQSPRLDCQGAVIELESRDIIASFEVDTAANWNLPKDYAATFEIEDEQLSRTNESYEYDDPWWVTDAKEAAEDDVIAWVASQLSSAARGELQDEPGGEAR